MNPSVPPGPADDPRTAPYPDLVASGGLRPALASTARELHVDLDFAGDGSESDAQDWSTARIASPRGEVRVNLGLGVRRFALTMESGRGYVWASGSTTELSEAVGAIAFWREGATLVELGARFPFMEFSRMSRAYEDGNPIETQWAILMESDEFPSYRELLAALHADPGLRRLFPFFSHWTLRMTADHHDAGAGEIVVRRRAGEDYVLWSSAAPDRKVEFRRVEDVVRAAAALRPTP